MAKREKKERKITKQKTPDWMVTYGDMTTLLLTFFVLMFTVAEIDGQELKLILSSFTGSFGIQTGGLTLQEGPLAEMGQQIETLPSPQEGENLAEMTEQEVSLKQDIEEEEQVEMVTEERGLKIMLLGDSFFREGSAELTNKGREIVRRIGNFIEQLSSRGPAYDYEVIAEGHTDNTPVSQTRVKFDNNWELSVLRATTLVEYWVDVMGLSPVRTTVEGELVNKFQSVGYGKHRPIASNDTPEGRARNRRVEIIIKKKNTIQY
jgi:chemotaxis protein MotB